MARSSMQKKKILLVMKELLEKTVDKIHTAISEIEGRI